MSHYQQACARNKDDDFKGYTSSWSLCSSSNQKVLDFADDLGDGCFFFKVQTVLDWMTAEIKVRLEDIEVPGLEITKKALGGDSDAIKQLRPQNLNTFCFYTLSYSFHKPPLYFLHMAFDS